MWKRPGDLGVMSGGASHFRVLGTTGPHGHGIGCRLALRIHWDLEEVTVRYRRVLQGKRLSVLC